MRVLVIVVRNIKIVVSTVKNNTMGAENLQLLELKTEITLIPAIPEDLKELNYYRDAGPNKPKEKVMKLRAGIPYWLLSPITHEIEPAPYLLNERSDAKLISQYLRDQTIFIAKDPFRHE